MHIRVEHFGPVTRVLLDRPEVHNAFDATTIGELQSAFEHLGGDDAVRVILMAGNGKSFCAGADARWMLEQGAQSEAENRAGAERLARLLLTIHRCPKPVVASVQGAALGGGVGLIAAADLAIASEAARFGLREARVGIIPATISPMLFRKIGPGWTRALALTAADFGAAQALAIGLVHRVVPHEDLTTATRSLVDDLLLGAPGAHAAAKALFDQTATMDPDTAAPVTAAALARARSSPEGVEGFTAFKERRRPSWATSWPGMGNEA